MKLELRRIGQEIALALPDDLLARAGLSAGDFVDMRIDDDGSIRLVADREMTRAMRVARQVMDEYSETLKALADS